MAELWRYPVKSMRGESVDSVDVLADGIRFDRRYAFVSSGAPAGKPRLTSRERTEMLRYSAAVVGDAVKVVTPTGEEFAVDDAALLHYMEKHLSLGHRIRLEHDPAAPPCTDVRPIAVHSTAAMYRLNHGFGQTVDARRFRSNVVLQPVQPDDSGITGDHLDPFQDAGLSGRLLCMGSAELRLLERIPRCRIVTLDPVTVEPAPELMKYLDRRQGGRLGMYAAVNRPGSVRVGDPVWLSA